MIKGNKYKHYKGGKSNNIYTRPLEEFKEKFELVSSNYFLE